jgi:xylan 1,4-beta-xylosidase
VTRVISVDAATVKGECSKAWRKCVGSGYAYLGLREDYRRHLEIVRRECGFEYVRFHGLLHDSMGIYTEDREGRALYNWQYLDKLYDGILDAGMRPFVEISFMPEALASGKQPLFFWRANVTPPKSYERFGELVYNLASHLTRRYGENEVRKWYFEIWNEPNHPAFFSGDLNDYFRLYETAARAIKDVCPGYRVGGPASAGPQWIREIIDFCHTNRVPIDFISTHAYAVDGVLDEFGTKLLYMSEDPGAIVNTVKQVRGWIDSSRMPELELHYTEWSTSYSSRDPVHDSYVSAPFILSKLKRVEGLADSMSYWTFSDVFEEAGPGPGHFHGGFGLLNLQELRKPSFFAYKFLNELGDTEIGCDDPDAFACKSDDGVQVLFWNYTCPKQDAPNQVFYKRDLPPGSSQPALLTIDGLEEGRYEMTVCQTGYRVNDVYTAYLDMSVPWPETLSRDQVRMLDEQNSGRPVSKKSVYVEKGQPLSERFQVRDNDVFLVKLSRG